MDQRKVEVGDLRVGMYVAELDCSWLDSPFLFQGFTIQDEEDLSQLRETCKFVYIDNEKSGDIDPEELDNGPDGEAEVEIHAEFSEELTRAWGIHERGKGIASKLLEKVRLGRSVETEEAREVVSDLVTTVSNNPNASLWLTNLMRQDEYLAAHSMNTSVLAVAFARHLGYDRETMETIGMGALLHDIGLMRTPRSILEKPGPLTDEEFEIIKRHPREGYNVLRLIRGMPEMVLDIVRYHHERVDGSGYPEGLKGDEIPREVLLVAVVDVYDALTSSRPYAKNPLLPHEALGKLRETGATDFGGELVGEFMRCIGIYPVSSLVELSSGALAVVVSHTQATRLRPIVMMIRDAAGNPYSNRPFVNLDALMEGMDADKWQILGVRNPKDYGIDMSEIAEAQTRN